MSTKIDEMSDEEIELRLALIERRKRAPVALVAAPTVVRLQGRKARAAIEERLFSALKVCPHCGKEKNVGKDFGIAMHRGVQYANSWCSQCRSETSNSYRTKPRKNNSKHNPLAPVAKKPRAKK